ncbi:MAG: hypothetical protein WCK47_12180 [bacterium]|nr:hypothetical protein [Candidatus Sumerlaeota bacterium]
MESEAPNINPEIINFGFTGGEIVRLDSALRVVIPAVYKEVLEKYYQPNSAEVVCVLGSGIVRVLPAQVFQAEAARLMALPALNPNAKKLRQFFFGNMKKCPLDAQNRIRLSENLVKYGKLLPDSGSDDTKPGKKPSGSVNVAVVGQHNEVQIWNIDRWNQFNATMSDNYDELLEIVSPSVNMVSVQAV